MIDFSNMIDKPLRHAFVPADQASITFVFQDGMRRSFGAGAGNVIASDLPPDLEGALITRTDHDQSTTPGAFVFSALTNRGPINLVYRGVLIELPE